MLKDLLIWGAWRYALQMCSKTYPYNVLEDLPFWCTYLDVHCWWRMSSNFVVFYFLFEWNQPVNHRMPLEINLKFLLPNPKSKSNLLWFCEQCSDFHPANNVMKQISPHPTLPYKLSKFKKPHWFVCLNHHETFTPMSYRYLNAFRILYEYINN